MRCVSALAAIVVWGAPALALACPVCFDANEANRDAYLGTTILLSLLPLAFVGGVVLFLRAKASKRDDRSDTIQINRPTRP